MPRASGNARVPNDSLPDPDTPDEDILIGDLIDPEDDSDYPLGPDEFKDLTTMKNMFLARYNPWGKTKREQLQSWNNLSFDPQKSDIDEQIELELTLGNMLQQDEQAKIEKFIETMPTIIQTHLIIAPNWEEVTKKAKNLEHII